MKMKLKALAIKEPWASLIRDGKKTIETRTWNTKHRGLFAVYVSQTPKSEYSGKVIALANLKDVRVMTNKDQDAACCEVYEKAKSWVLENVTPIKPVTLNQRGQLGFFEVEIDIHAMD